VFDKMIFGKYVPQSNSSLMLRNIERVSGTVYTEYDHLDENLFDKDFYVVTEQGGDRSVFKCISNNRGATSTAKPVLSETSPVDDLYQTSDGYIWKLMFTVPQATYEKFASTDFIPYVANTAVSNAAIDGSVDNIKLDQLGSGYDNYASGTIVSVNVNQSVLKFYIQANSGTTLSATPQFYTDCAIYITSGLGQGQQRKIINYGFEGNNRFIIVDTPFSTSINVSDSFEISPNVELQGDGSGFKARALIEPTANTVERIEIVNRGSGYSYANVDIQANTAVLDANAFTEASATAVISPKGGHGFDPRDELEAKYVTLNTEFTTTELPTANNDFRTIGIINNPIFNEAILEVDSVANVVVGDTVTQTNTGVKGDILSIDSSNSALTLTNVTGPFNANDTLEVANTATFSITNINKNNEVYDQRLQLDVSMTFLSEFDKDELVIQQNTNAKGYVHEFSNNTLYLVEVEGTFSVSGVSQLIGQTSTARAVINNIEQADMVDNSGKVIYIENINPITRQDTQSEIFNITIGF
jgi:hypothetical protein